MPRDSISLSDARRMALAAQGFNCARPKTPVSAADIAAVIRRLGLLQLDYVNVLAPAHYLVLYSRLGAYDLACFHEGVYRRREFTEQWAHEASIVPMETWPLLEYRRKSHRVRPWGFEKFLAENPDYEKAVLEQVRAHGPLTAGEVDGGGSIRPWIPESWISTVEKGVLEAHFGRGALAVAERRRSFARAYDLAERVVPEVHFERKVDREEAHRQLLLHSARAMGVATAGDLADYFRMPVPQARPRIAELLEAGAMQETRVEGWREPAYRDPEATAPRRIKACALLAPFDPLIWFRARAERLFGFHYRVEIYVPPAKRKWGYYVLPFLLGEQLVARVDLKADRENRRLLVQAAHIEPGADQSQVAPALAGELLTMAKWLGLSSVAVGRRGNLAAALRRDLP